MRTARIDRILQVSIGVLLAAFVYVIFVSLYDRIVQVGDTAPDFSITADSGQTITPTNFGGKLLVLNFWATWCQPCRDEIPQLEALHQRYFKDDVIFVGVSVDAAGMGRPHQGHLDAVRPLLGGKVRLADLASRDVELVPEFELDAPVLDLAPLRCDCSCHLCLLEFQFRRLAVLHPRVDHRHRDAGLELRGGHCGVNVAHGDPDRLGDRPGVLAAGVEEPHPPPRRRARNSGAPVMERTLDLHPPSPCGEGVHRLCCFNWRCPPLTTPGAIGIQGCQSLTLEYGLELLDQCRFGR